MLNSIAEVSAGTRARLAELYEQQRVLYVEVFKLALAETARFDGGFRAHSEAILNDHLRGYRDEGARFIDAQLRWLCDVIVGNGVVPARPPQSRREYISIGWRQFKTAMICVRVALRHIGIGLFAR